MCSVVGCDSWRRGAQRFGLPEDPEKRLEWVQFLADVNGQCFKESSWTDITICVEHFAYDCYDSLITTSVVQLKPRAVPSLYVKSEPDEQLDNSQHVEQVETADVSREYGSQASSGSSSAPFSHSPDASNTSTLGHMQQNIDLKQEKAPSVSMKGKASVNANCLMQLIPNRCPSCGSALKMEKVTYETLIILYQQCLECDYTNQSHVNSAQSLTDDILVAPDIKQEPVHTAESACQCDLITYDSPPSGFEESRVNANGVSNTDTSGQIQQKKKENIDLNQKRVSVSESCLLQLFRRKCPSCGSKLEMEKVTHGILITLNLQCLKCEYRYQWRSQVNARVPTPEGQHTATEITPDTQQGTLLDVNANSGVSSEIVTLNHEESNPSDEGEEEEGTDQGAACSDGEWNPTEDVLLAEELAVGLDEEETYEQETDEEEDLDSHSGLRINELCTDCGSFFNIQKPHTCEYKIKPYSCNVCGKRCATETSLKHHSNIHAETYEHPCKYCHVTFKTRLDKLKHEETHQNCRKPYKCPDCSETFATNKKRSIHLADHRISREFVCGVCGIAFKDKPHLQRHSVVHTGLKPYKCSECQRSFSQSSHLKSHMRLHTGEKPFKCQHCDKCFNHNVSLKSHLQRYHTSSSGCQRKKGKKGASDTSEAKVKGTDLELLKEEEHTEEEGKSERITTAQTKSWRRNTGRPRGRPKRDAAGNLILGTSMEDSNTKVIKVKVQKLKRKVSGNELTDNDTSCDSAAAEEEEDERSKTTRKNAGRGGRRQKGDDSDFDPEKESLMV